MTPRAEQEEHRIAYTINANGLRQAACSCGYTSPEEATAGELEDYAGGHLRRIASVRSGRSKNLRYFKKWEYRMELIPASIDIPDKIAGWLNEFGADGWELAFWGSRACILKRRRV